MQRRRIDSEMVRRHLARSRTQAAELIAAGRVTLDGQAAAKAATQVDPAQAIEVLPDKDGEPDYASRAGHKLAGALDELARRGDPVDLTGAIVLDAGASTGGFTDVVLRRGAALVYAVDVGYGQLSWSLQTDPRVEVRDRTNVRFLKAGDFDPAPGVVVGDLSFISLTTVLPALVAAALPGAAFYLMVKPQFEVGKRALPRGGVVRDPAQRAGAVAKVAQAAAGLGLGVEHVVRSPLPGPSGNVEFFLALTRAARPAPRAVAAQIAAETGAPLEGAWTEALDAAADPSSGEVQRAATPPAAGDGPASSASHPAPPVPGDGPNRPVRPPSDTARPGRAARVALKTDLEDR
jgi:23S rRNA (cytidine1920-2'-O)/16S rRNA (cytidine1409-2'-O)-methyltransferase